MNRIDSIQRQLYANKDVNLLYPTASQSMVIDPHFRGVILQAKTIPISQQEIDSLVGMAVRGCVQSILRLNQYLNISDRHRKRLADLYHRTWYLLQSNDDVDSVLRAEHYPAIQAWVSELYPQDQLKALMHQQAIRAVTCSEYSAELQMDVLALDIEDIHGPVLDIGCGFSAPLVHYLLSRDVEVYGFDRIVEKETSFIKEADWFNYNYLQRSWGTIISHMAFSNHYRYTLNHDHELKKKMESVFSIILSSLSLGGCLVFAPGSKDLELATNDRSYRIEISHIVNDFTLMKIWYTN